MPFPPSGTGTTVYALKVTVSAPNNGPSLDITSIVDRDTIRIEESGSLASPSCEFEITDKALAFTLMRGQWRVIITYTIPGTTTTRTLFNGFIRNPRSQAQAIYGRMTLTAEGIDTMMDRLIVRTEGLRRADTGTDKARIQWLFQEVGQPLIGMGLTDWSKVQVLESNMPNQTFPPRLTLRQALERILAAASTSANYFMDPGPRLWTWDDANPIGTAGAAVATSGRAPYDVNATAAPGAGNIAPADLLVEWDSSNYYNGYYVQAANPRVSRFYTDATLQMATPYAKDIYGNSWAYLQAPDADTTAKVQRIAKAAIRDTRNPVPRISFTVEGADCFNGTVGWQGGQLVYITSAIHGLTGSTTDTNWAGYSGANQALQPFRVVRVTTTLMNGGSTLQQEIEVGGRQLHAYQGGS